MGTGGVGEGEPGSTGKDIGLYLREVRYSWTAGEEDGVTRIADSKDCVTE